MISQKFFLGHGPISGVGSEAPNDMLTREVHHNLGAMKIRHAMSFRGGKERWGEGGGCERGKREPIR